MKMPSIFLALVMLGAAPAGQAAVLASYQFGAAGNETAAETGVGYAPTTTATNVMATNVTDPAGTVGIEISSAGPPPGAPFLRLDPQGGSATPAAALAANKYFQFGVSSDASFLINLTSLTFNAARGGAGTPRGYVVRSSADGFSADLASADLLTARPVYTPVNINLTGAAFQGVSSLTFRVYSYSPAPGNSIDYDDIVVNGEVVPVPEPSVSLLAAAGVVGMLSRRRNRK